MGYLQERKERKERTKAKELILSTVHEKLYSIESDCIDTAKAYDRNTIPMKLLKITVDMARVKPDELAKLDERGRVIPDAYNVILDSILQLCKDISKNFGGKISIRDIKSAINVNWFKFEERIELTYSTVSEVNDNLNKDEKL